MKDPGPIGEPIHQPTDRRLVSSDPIDFHATVTSSRSQIVTPLAGSRNPNPPLAVAADGGW
jgi:hypothetical protein